MSGGVERGGVPLEIERKFLIRRPDETLLDMLGTERWEIVQTYLVRSSENVSRRVRDVFCAGAHTY